MFFGGCFGYDARRRRPQGELIVSHALSWYVMGCPERLVVPCTFSGLVTGASAGVGLAFHPESGRRCKEREQSRAFIDASSCCSPAAFAKLAGLERPPESTEQSL